MLSAVVISGHFNGFNSKLKLYPSSFFCSLYGPLFAGITTIHQYHSRMSYIFFTNLNWIPAFFHQTYVLDPAVSKHIPTVSQTGWSLNAKLIAIIVEERAEVENCFRTADE